MVQVDELIHTITRRNDEQKDGDNELKPDPTQQVDELKRHTTMTSRHNEMTS